MNYIEFLHNCYVNNIPLELDGEYHIIEFLNCVKNNLNSISFKNQTLYQEIKLCGKIAEYKYINLDIFIKKYSDQLLLQYRKMKIEKIKSKIKIYEK